jgi:YD repeat-containing protein
MSYGNGAVKTHTLNSRLQPGEYQLQTNSNGVNQKVFDKVFCYGPAVSGCANYNRLNNGSILAENDLLSSSQNQTFAYDSLNRLSSFATGNGTFSQTYSYDPFGNMNQVAPGTLQSNLSFATNNRVSTSGFVYDGAGNLTQSTPIPGNSQYFSYDGDSRLVGYNSGSATYQYNPEGQRVRKDVGANWNEYLYFGGQLMPEKNSDGSWFNYIYAEGQRIATEENEDIFIQTK